MSIIVSDASPLINLARLNRFDLLAAFYGQVTIPQAVYDEVVVQGAGRDGSHEVDDRPQTTIVHRPSSIVYRPCTRATPWYD